MSIHRSIRQPIAFTAIILSMVIVACGGNSKSTDATSTAAVDSINTPPIDLTEPIDTVYTSRIDRNIRSIFQDRQGNYWFGTNSAGVYRYDGKSVTQYTVKDGLSNNQVNSIQQDASGHLWFGTGLFGVSRFDGKKFTAFTDKENLRVSHGTDDDWRTTPNDLWFYAGGGAYRYDGDSLVYLPLTQPAPGSSQSAPAPFELSRFSVYSLLKDKKGNVWFGTQAQGVCRFDGKNLKWFTEKNLAGPAVLAIYEDSQGNTWFGNNGGGLYKYDGKKVINISAAHGLDNEEFRASGQSNAGSVARIYAINEDNAGNIWIGTVDAGVWRFDGNEFKQYSAKDGLHSNAINTIYKDKDGVLWFGTDSDGVWKFDGIRFSMFAANPH
jgi:ligand-binding sensor domain-containing protein